MISRNIWIFLLFIISALIFSQCTSRYSQKDADKFLSTERVSAKTSPISFLMPQGWRVIDANDSTFIDLWLINDDYKSSLSLIPLHSEKKNQNLTEWINVSKFSTKMKFKNEEIKIVDDGDDQINGINTSSYYFKNNSSLQRITVFKFNGKYYELTALDKGSNHGETSSIKYLSKIQSAFIASIK